MTLYSRQIDIAEGDVPSVLKAFESYARICEADEVSRPGALIMRNMIKALTEVEPDLSSTSHHDPSLHPPE